MLEYIPWSRNVVSDAIKSISKGVFTALDIELSGKCPYNCVYCETPYRDRQSSVDFAMIERFLDTKQFKWVYICGIGEPTYDCNEDYLVRILESCKKNGARCSTFTNLSNLSDRLIQYVKDGILHLIIKYDSLNPDLIQSIYNPDDVSKHLSNIERIYDLVQVKDNQTNIAASIVPTTHNKDEIDALVTSCLEHGIFPLMGQLENSGSAKDVYDELFLDDETLKDSKSRIEKYLGEIYYIPFCPAVITGFHISNDNLITLDKRTGLSCHWFWLDEPNVEILCDLRETDDIEAISRQIIEIRKNRFQQFLSIKDTLVSDIFGGCGGNKKEIFDIYAELMSGGTGGNDNK